MDLILKYFPNLTPDQQDKFSQTEKLYSEWNNRINVISRKDMEHFYERHVLHSLGIAKIQTFKPGSSILDVGTGGGFPGIPLAIMFPDTEFLLVDSIGKKIKVVQAVAETLKLKNVRALHTRAEEIKEKFDFIVSRAVTALPDFIKWVDKNTHKENRHELKNGILYLKGGDLDAELAPVKREINIYNLNMLFETEFFETKKVVHVVL